MKYLFFVILAFLSVGCSTPPNRQTSFANELAARAERGSMDDFTTANESFILAAKAGNRETILSLLSPTTIRESKEEIGVFLDYVLRYFSDFERSVSCNGITNTKDAYGNAGYIFHRAFITKQGDKKPYKMALLRENGRVYVSNVAPLRTEYHFSCYQ